MSKSAEEQATEIVVSLLSTEKGLAYIGSGNATELGTKLSNVWTKLFETIRDAAD